MFISSSLYGEWISSASGLGQRCQRRGENAGLSTAPYLNELTKNGEYMEANENKVGFCFTI